MYSYLVKRSLLFIPTILLASIAVFVLMRIIPGDPALQILAGDLGGVDYTQQQLDDLRAKLGTDRPIVVQYGDWVWRLLHLDFGKSFLTHRSISEDLINKVPITLELAILSLILATLVAVPLGVFSAINQDTWGDYVARVVAIAGVALPTFWTGILVIYFLTLVFEWLPPLGYTDLWDDPWKNLQQLIFPAIALGVFNMAFVARVTRSAMLEVFREEYVRTARAKGLAERVVIARHALRNALLPVVTVSGWQFGQLVGSAVIIENIFLVPGLGRFLLESIFQRDYAVTQAVIMVITFWVVLANLFVDMVYGWLDPRIRYQ